MTSDACGGTGRGWGGLEEGTGALTHVPEGTPAASSDFLL